MTKAPGELDEAELGSNNNVNATRASIAQNTSKGT